MKSTANYQPVTISILVLTFLLFMNCRPAGLHDETPGANEGTVVNTSARGSHPRLILDPSRIAALKKVAATTHADLWRLASASADSFSKEEIPHMKDAHNEYRTFGDTMPVLALAYLMTGDRRYVDAADRWVNAFLDVPEWKGSQNLGRSAWVVGSAIIYDWLHDVLPTRTIQRIRERLVAEGDVLLRETSYWRLLSNHCLIEIAAIGMIGLTLEGEHERAAEFIKEADVRTKLVIEHAPLDGSWGEGVQYWQYGLGYFLRFLEASKTSGHTDYYPSYDWLKKTGFFPIHFSLPSDPARSVNFSDSGDSKYTNGFLMYLPASAYRNGYFQDFANKTRSTEPYRFSWMDFISYDATVEPLDYTTLSEFKHFEDNGFVIMRSSWAKDATLVGFRCGPAPGHRNQVDPRRLERKGFGPGHGHPDINSFSLFAYGRWMALDPGYVYEKWTHDHNTIVVNDKGQAGEGDKWLDYMAFESREPVPTIRFAETKPDYDYLIGDAGNIYVEEAGLQHFRRHLLFLKPNTVVILDDVKAKRPSKVDWLLQAYDQAKQTGRNEFEITRDGVRLWVRVMLPSVYEPSIKSHESDGSATNGKITTLDLTVKSSEQSTFLVVMTALPDEKAGVPAVDLKKQLLTINHAGKRWRVEVKDAGKASDPSTPLLVVK